MKVYHSKSCGSLVLKLVDAGCDLICGDEKMDLLEAGTTDAAREKHVPAVTREGNKVSVVVGSVEHPMLENHYIQFIALEQGDKVQVVSLKPGEKPAAEFVVEDGPVTVYEFCNLHGLWKAEA